MITKLALRKSISKIVFAGLLISTFPAPALFGAAQPEKAPLKISQAEIKKHAADIKKVVTGVKAVKTIANLALTGTGIASFLISLALGSTFFLPGVPFVLTLFGTPISALYLALTMGSAALGPIIFFLVFEVVMWGTKKLGTTQIKAIRWLLEKGVLSLARKGVEKLERIERDYPGTLTLEQKNIIAQFNKLITGTTMRAIMQATRLKGTLMDITKSVIVKTNALGKNPTEAIKIINKYIELTWRTKGYKKTLATYYEKKRKYKTIIKERSPLSIAYHKAKFKLAMLNLNPKYLWIKNKKAKAEKTIHTFNKKHPKLKPALKDSLPDFIKKADAIVQKYTTPLKLLQKRLRKEMKTIIKSTIAQNLKLELLPEQERAYWIVREYVELKWKSRNLQRTMDALRQKSQGSALQKAFSTATSAVMSVIQLKLMKFKWTNYIVTRLKKADIDKRIKQIEKKYLKLKPSLKSASQEFTKKADSIIAEKFQSPA